MTGTCMRLGNKNGVFVLSLIWNEDILHQFSEVSIKYLGYIKYISSNGNSYNLNLHKNALSFLKLEVKYHILSSYCNILEKLRAQRDSGVQQVPLRTYLWLSRTKIVYAYSVLLHHKLYNEMYEKLGFHMPVGIKTPLTPAIGYLSHCFKANLHNNFIRYWHQT